LQANPTVDAGGKIDPVPVGAFSIFARPFMDTGNWASVHAVSDAFAGICNNRMWHGGLEASFSTQSYTILILKRLLKHGVGLLVSL
jgi:hypothetical protein